MLRLSGSNLLGFIDMWHRSSRSQKPSLKDVTPAGESQHTVAMGENKETKQFFFESYELACPMAITGYIFYIFISGLPPTTLGETRQVLCRDLASNQDDYLWRLVGQQKKSWERHLWKLFVRPLEIFVYWRSQTVTCSFRHFYELVSVSILLNFLFSSFCLAYKFRPDCLTRLKHLAAYKLE